MVNDHLSTRQIAIAAHLLRHGKAETEVGEAYTAISAASDTSRDAQRHRQAQKDQRNHDPSRPATPMTSSRLLARALPKSSDAPSVNSASGVATEPRLRSGVSMRGGMGIRKYQSRNPASVPRMSG